MSISRLLVLGLSLFAAVLSAACLVEVVRVERAVTAIGQFHTPALTQLLRVKADVHLMIQEILTHHHSLSPDDHQDYLDHLVGLEHHLEAFESIAKVHRPGEEQELQLFTEICEHVETLQAQADVFFSLSRDDISVFFHHFDEFERTVDRLNAAITSLERIEMAEVDEAQDLAVATMNDAKITFVVISFLAIAGAFILGSFLAKRIAKPLRRLECGAARVGIGERESVVVDGPREVRRLATCFNDMADAITERHNTLQQEIEMRAARYRTLVEHAPEAIVVLDAENGTFVDVNQNACQLFKMSREELARTDPVSQSPEFQPSGARSDEAAGEVIRAAINGEAPVFEWTHLDALGNEIPCEVRLIRLPSSEGILVRGSVTDISERKANEERQKMMLRELDHRVKNNLAIVQALFDQSLNDAQSLAECQAAFSGRIQAMAKTHEALAAEHWVGVDLDTTLRMVLDPYLAQRDRIRMSGSEVSLTSRMANPFGLAVHELATNAAKYGALSNGTGRVEVTWSRLEDDSIRLHWIERDGPEVAPPTEPGLGLRLVKGLVEHQLGGQVDLRFEAQGLTCNMILPRSA